MGRYLHDILIAIESIMANQLRSILTALGIIFGVAAVITMLAIGRGAQQEILDQIKMVGVNNIMITPIVEPEQGDNGANIYRAVGLEIDSETFLKQCTDKIAGALLSKRLPSGHTNIFD